MSLMLSNHVSRNTPNCWAHVSTTSKIERKVVSYLLNHESLEFTYSWPRDVIAGDRKQVLLKLWPGSAMYLNTYRSLDHCRSSLRIYDVRSFLLEDSELCSKRLQSQGYHFNPWNLRRINVVLNIVFVCFVICNLSNNNETRFNNRDQENHLIIVMENIHIIVLNYNKHMVEKNWYIL